MGGPLVAEVSLVVPVLDDGLLVHVPPCCPVAGDSREGHVKMICEIKNKGFNT